MYQSTVQNILKMQHYETIRNYIIRKKKSSAVEIWKHFFNMIHNKEEACEMVMQVANYFPDIILNENGELIYITTKIIPEYFKDFK